MTDGLQRQGGVRVKEYMEQRILEAALFTIDNNSTVRETAKHLGVSKSTVHKDLTKRLPKIDYKLFEEVDGVISKNKNERHIRGGNATREKFEKRKGKLSLAERWEADDKSLREMYG